MVSIVAILAIGLLSTSFVCSFVPAPRRLATPLRMSQEGNAPDPHPFCQLPGDPTLILTTNVDLGDKKMEIMKVCSKIVAAATGKPESFVGPLTVPFPLQFEAVCINDKASVIFGGSDAPAALGTLYSIGSISKASNGQVQAGVTDQLEGFGVAEDRIYIAFFDIDRANMGWSRATFAG